MIELHLETSRQLAKLVCPTMNDLVADRAPYTAWTRRDMIDFAALFRARLGKGYSNFGGGRRNESLILTVLLPEHYGACVKFLTLCWNESQITGNGNIRRSLTSLHDRLRAHMGLPHAVKNRGASRQELAFLNACYENPGDLVNWMAYGDWLAEAGDERGYVIQRNFDSKKRVYKRWK